MQLGPWLRDGIQPPLQIFGTDPLFTDMVPRALNQFRPRKRVIDPLRAVQVMKNTKRAALVWLDEYLEDTA